MSTRQGFRFFKDDLCDRCGLCFERCPVLELPNDEARRQIEILIRGDIDASLVLQRCQTCNLCEFTCPQSASPFGLILERFNEMGKEEAPKTQADLIRRLIEEKVEDIRKKKESRLNHANRLTAIAKIENEYTPLFAKLLERQKELMNTEFCFAITKSFMRSQFNMQPRIYDNIMRENEALKNEIEECNSKCVYVDMYGDAQKIKIVKDGYRNYHLRALSEGLEKGQRFHFLKGI